MHAEVMVTFEAGYGPSFGDEDLMVERRVIAFPREECSLEPHGLHHREASSERIYPWHTIRLVEVRAVEDEVPATAEAVVVADVPEQAF